MKWIDALVGRVTGRRRDQRVRWGTHSSPLHPMLRSARSDAARKLALFATTACLAGCVHFIEPQPPPPDPEGAFVPITAPVIFVGDTQEHETTGFPLRDNDGAIDAYVEVAQRPPEQPLFGRRILEWAMQTSPDTPVVHLGDLLDMSCESEMGRIARVFDRSSQPKAILPGNHDGFFLGIFNLNALDALLDGEAAKWDRTCRRGTAQAPKPAEAASGAALTKRGFIVEYLRNLARGPHTRVTEVRVESDGDAEISWRNPDQRGFIQAIEARIFGGRRFGRSFVVQKLKLPAAAGANRRTILVGLDTNQTDAAVTTLDTLRGLSPGDLGHVRADQVEVIDSWLREARAAGDIVVFAGHHNWKRLSFASQARLFQAMKTLDQPLVYISAHTHRGFWAKHRIAGRSLLELNVSSLSDWPIAYREVTLAFDEKANRLQVIAAIRPSLDASPANDQELLAAWEAKTCGGTGFTSDLLERQDLLVVEQQRNGRGSLMEWIYEGFGEWCGACQQTLYESGMRYQDALLETVSELYQDFSVDVPAVKQLRPPAACAGVDTATCIAQLLQARPATLPEAQALFRRRAEAIAAIDEQLDDRRRGRGEANRRRQDFFRTEATVGLD